MSTEVELRAAIARAGRVVRRNPDDREARETLARLRAEYHTVRLGEHIRRIVAEAPPLSDEQREGLALLLRGTAA
jgi:outer membrane protein assembly factor BamD (BamD/ComL family)